MPEKKKRIARLARVWIALSSAGYPAPTVGYAFTRTDLRANYQGRFGHDLERAGYHAVRVQLTAPPSPGDDA